MAAFRSILSSRFFSTSLRLLNAGQPIQTTKRLPKLTLYTGGPECSLCEIMKQDLSVVRLTHPFELDTFNIREPPKEVDPEKAKQIEELYRYDIPILHLDGHYIQKHRLNSNPLKKLLESYDPSDPDPPYAHNKFRPWTGVSHAKPKKQKKAAKAMAQMEKAYSAHRIKKDAPEKA